MPTRLLILSGALLLVGLTGCEQLRWNGLKPTRITPPPRDLPSVASLVNYLNDNADRIKTITAKDIDLTASQGLQSFGLRARMDAEKPRNFRMRGFVAGNEMVDLGSNDQEFWWWMSKGDPYQFYCNYKDLEAGRVQQLAFPFQPDWIMETMGLGPFGPPEKYLMEHDNDTIKLIERTTSPQGRPVRKVIVFSRRPVQPPEPQIRQYLIVDEATGQEVCSANITETILEKNTNAFLPRRIEFRWPEKRVRLKLKLDEVEANPPVRPQIFVRPALAGVPGFNLATGRPDATIQVQGSGQ